uniref:Ig-like domain-containing protein n=1 Tax=Cyclopterus lumpus TaxID=8103 RepID=A0A8C2ZME9_CYCLU
MGVMIPAFYPMTLFVGKQAVLQCSLTGSSPMEVVWHKDNIAISEGNYVMKCEKNKYSLLIKSLELTDQGVYLCKASNSVGTATFTTELKVINKPSFVKTVEPVAAAVNDPLRLECQVDEDTGVTVTWTRDGKKVHQSMDCKLAFEDKVAVVDIAKSKQKDSGKYVCTATNEAGSSSCEAVVTPSPAIRSWRSRPLRVQMLEIISVSYPMMWAKSSQRPSLSLKVSKPDLESMLFAEVSSLAFLTLALFL